MKVLFTLMPAISHFHSLMPVARELEAAGHDVGWASSGPFLDSIKSTGVRTFPAGPRWLVSETNKEFPEAGMMTDPAQAVAYVNAAIFNEVLPGFTSIIDAWKPDVLVCDINDYSGPAAAELAGLPFARHSIGLTHNSQRVKEIHRGTLDLLRAEAGLPDDPDFTWLHRYLFLDNCPPSLQSIHEDIPVRHRVRPVPFDDSQGVGYPTWLDDLPQRPTVYATAGSVFNRLPIVLDTVLRGLADEDINLVLTVGTNRDPNELGTVPDNVHVERYIPHTLLLPRCDLVISHGGFNTVLGAIMHGLPTLTIPVNADNPFNAQRSVEAGVGRMLTLEALAPELVRIAVRDLLADDSYRQAAARIRAEVETLPGPEEAVPVLERLARDKAPQLAPL